MDTADLDIRSLPKYKNFKEARIVRQDHDRKPILDFFITNLYKIYVLIHNRNWQEAFLTCYTNLKVCEIFNEFIICSKHLLLMVLMLQKMEIHDRAIDVLDFLRDLVEDTNLNKEAIIVYQEMGKMYQEQKEYLMAIKAFKRMLQIAWVENDQNSETKAYEYLAL